MLPSIVDDPAWTVRVDDLRGCSFERFVTYAFDRPVPRTDKEPNWWHGEGVDEVELLIDGASQLEHSCAVFRDPLMLHDRFSPDQIEQGFWFLGMGHWSDYGAFFMDALWDEQLDVGLRCRCVSTMFDLYEKLFSPFPAETATYMWWDLIASFVLEPLGQDEVVPHSVSSHERVRQEMVQTLGRILTLEPRHCQTAALHGLNHVATTAERSPLIEEFLRLHHVDEKLRTYAYECLVGQAQ